MQPTIQTLRAIFIPTVGQAMGSFAVAVLLLILTQGQLIISTIAQKAYIPEESLGFVISEQLIKLSQIPFAERFAVGLFWAVVASVVYVLAITVNNALVTARNEVVIETQFSNGRGRQHQIVNVLLVRLAWGILLLGLAFLTFAYLFPYWMELFRQPLIGDMATEWWKFLIGLFALTVNIYGLWVLFLATKSAQE